MCTNGQEHAENALNFAAQLFQYIKPDAGIVTVIKKFADSCEDEEKRLERAKKICANYGIQATAKILEGHISNEIIKESCMGNYDLLIMGSRGYSDMLGGVTELILGETVQDVIQEAESSFLIVKEPKPIHKVLICTDGSYHAEESAHFWGKLNISNQPKINIINVVPEIYSRFKDILEPVAESQLDMLGALPGKRTEFLYKTKDILIKHGIEAKIKLREGNAAKEILKEAKNDYDLIVMGRGGRKGDKKKTLGRQTRRVIREANIPVLAIRSQEG